jgi:hypothetical protein
MKQLRPHVADTEACHEPDQSQPEDEEQRTLRGLADNLRNKTAAAYLSVAAAGTPGSSLPPQAFAEYMQQLLAEAGNPRDPIERMLIEQIALAHHNIGRLYSRAASAQHLDQAKAYYAASVRLLAEFRRSVLAWKKYREPASVRNFTVVKQQNLAQNQQVAFIEPTAALPGCEEPSEDPTNIGYSGMVTGVLQHGEEGPSCYRSETQRNCPAEPVQAKRSER